MSGVTLDLYIHMYVCCRAESPRQCDLNDWKDEFQSPDTSGNVREQAREVLSKLDDPKFTYSKVRYARIVISVTIPRMYRCISL